MFINVMWNKDGKVNKTCVHISKLAPTVGALENKGITTWMKISP